MSKSYTVLAYFFDIKIQRPKTDLEKCYQCSVSFEISLDFKLYFSLLTVQHPDVFWYRLNSMGAKKNARKKVLVTLFPCIFHMKTK